MTDRRLKSVERVLAIQAQMRKLAEWRHQALTRDASAARDESRALVAALNGEGVLDGLFTDMTARRLHRVAISIWELDAAAAVQAGKVMQETGREKRAARLADQLRRVRQRSDEDRTLLDIMESAEGKRAADL